MKVYETFNKDRKRKTENCNKFKRFNATFFLLTYKCIFLNIPHFKCNSPFQKEFKNAQLFTAHSKIKENSLEEKKDVIRSRRD